MPIYEFICNNCNKKFEKLLKNNIDKDILCPQCKSDNIMKVLSTFSSIVKNNFVCSNNACNISNSCCKNCNFSK